jgi:starch synthase/alpha-amylase
MEFFRMPGEVREQQLSRIMKESRERFNLSRTARQYIELYEKMLHRPLVV